MAQILKSILHGTLMIALAGAIFVGSFFYETNYTQNVVLTRGNQVFLTNDQGASITVNRAGIDNKLSNGSVLEAGDMINTESSLDTYIKYSGDGVLRLADQTKLLLAYLDAENSVYVFKLIDGKAWLNNLYNNANVNFVVDGAVIEPGQSISYYQEAAGQTEVYANKSNLTIKFVKTDYPGNQLLAENSPAIINTLFLPQGTQATVFKDKIAENEGTIAKLLFSKLIKEFNYGLFDKTNLRDNSWLSDNVVKDNVLAAAVKNERLKSIRLRGLKYTDFNASNYKLDEFLRGTANQLTFIDEKIGKRNLDALYEDLYDAEYLYDNGRAAEAKTRLDEFKAMANQLVQIYGDTLKTQFRQRIKQEYQYLSFVEPADSLYPLKLVLEKIYLDSMQGEKSELTLKFQSLSEQLSALGYFAETKQAKNLKTAFDDYMNDLKNLIKTYEQELTTNLIPLEQQNQMLDNLFMQYPDFYRVSYMTSKLYVENAYLNLFPTGEDKLEEIQTVIAQRISFLKQLQNFFLNDEAVPILDAQNIMALLFSEIAKMELPKQYQVAISGLFAERLADYGVFARFLASTEYVNSKYNGLTMRDRFAKFQLEYGTVSTEGDLVQQTVDKLTTTNSDTTTNVTNNRIPRVKKPI